VNFYQTSRRYNPEGSHLHIRRRENKKSYEDSRPNASKYDDADILKKGFLVSRIPENYGTRIAALVLLAAIFPHPECLIDLQLIYR
jgi:hypothetical protein